MKTYIHIIAIISVVFLASSCSEKAERELPDYMEYCPEKSELIQLIEKYGPEHDAYLYLLHIGTEEDLKYLIYGLQQFDDADPVCTRFHCLEALRSISGDDIGNNSSNWVVWWEKKYNRKFTWHPKLKHDPQTGKYIAYETASNNRAIDAHD